VTLKDGQLTGETRFRAAGFMGRKLVLQVGVHVSSAPWSRYMPDGGTTWRDACVQDMTLLMLTSGLSNNNLS
jgi:hypothetical protein